MIGYFESEKIDRHTPLDDRGEFPGGFLEEDDEESNQDKETAKE